MCGFVCVYVYVWGQHGWGGGGGEGGGGGGVESQEEGEASGKEGMQSGLTLTEERSRVRRGSSGRDHHLPSLSFSRAVILNRPAVMTAPPPPSPPFPLTTRIDWIWGNRRSNGSFEIEAGGAPKTSL